MEAHWIVLAAIGIVSLVVSSLIIHAYERKIDDEYANASELLCEAESKGQDTRNREAGD
jgi:hypothetical protein